jgi:hypothetical protein
MRSLAMSCLPCAYSAPAASARTRAQLAFETGEPRFDPIERRSLGRRRGPRAEAAEQRRRELAGHPRRLDPPAAPLSPDEMAQARALFADQKKLLNTLDENLSSYLRMLDAADFELQQLTTTVANYGAFLDERLLWMPNAPPLSLSSIGDVVTATQWFLSPSNWSQTVSDVRNGARRAWPRLLLIVAAIAALVRARPGRASEGAPPRGGAAPPRRR